MESSLNKKKIIMIVIFIVIFFVAIFIFDSYLRNRKNKEISLTKQDNTGNNPELNLPEKTELEKQIEKEKALVDYNFSQGVRTAQIFAERFGSFSTEADYQNLKDLFSMMTDSMRSWAKGVVNFGEQKNSETDIIYFGVSTKVLNTKVLERTDDKMIVMLKTQRSEKGGNKVPVVYYKDIKIELVKINEVWKVDKAYWQD